MQPKLTHAAMHSIEEAISHARSLHHTEASDLHLLRAILRQPDSTLAQWEEAALACLSLKKEDCMQHAQKYSWENTAHHFLKHQMIIK